MENQLVVVLCFAVETKCNICTFTHKLFLSILKPKQSAPNAGKHAARLHLCGIKPGFKGISVTLNPHKILAGLGTKGMIRKRPLSFYISDACTEENMAAI